MFCGYLFVLILVLLVFVLMFTAFAIKTFGANGVNNK